jgi:glutamyl-tRNA synthetase
MTVKTRFAPSPTGYLHIGGARTALFNWLYARHYNGDFHLRIEDTDKNRNDLEAIQPIIDGLDWLGLTPDGAIVYQSDNAARHKEVAEQLVERGAAYRCYMSDDDVTAMKNINRKTGKALRSTFRDVTDTREGPFTIRLRMPDNGQTVIDDLVQGSVTVQNSTLDDMIILRSDGTPTYMLAVVVDDHDAGITHVIRGDDHLNNAFRQLQVIRAMGWAEPKYAHIPLILNEQGKKLSKRDGDAGIEWFEEKGFLPEAAFNYLLRMGWGHGDHEIVDRATAIKLFDLDGVGRAPARLDTKRLEHLNNLYLRDCPNDLLEPLILPLIDHERTTAMLADDGIGRLLDMTKVRSKTLIEMAMYIDMVLNRPRKKVESDLLMEFNEALPITDFTAVNIKAMADRIADAKGMKLKHVVEPLRLATVGSKISPPLFEVMELLGTDECRERLHFAITGIDRVSIPGWTLHGSS